jgi:hypothetical protein
MESKYHAIAFLVILAIVCLGAYVAIDAILSAGRTPLISLAAPTPTRLIIPQDDQTVVFPGSIPTNTPVAPPTPAVPTATPVLPTLKPTANLATATPVPVVATSTPTEMPSGPTPTLALPTPPGGYPYMPDGPVRSECGRPSALIYGWVRDAQGGNLEGVRVRVSDQWGNVAEAISKGGDEAGYYDVVRGMETVTWWVEVVDEAGNPLSPVVTIEPVQESASCWYQLDWQRTY